MFYLSVNEAKSNFLAKKGELEAPESSSETKIVSKKSEPNDPDEPVAHEVTVAETNSIESDFASVFYEVFIPDCENKMQETDAVKHRKRNTKRVECIESNLAVTSVTEVDKFATNEKPPRTVSDERPSLPKRPLDTLDADLICEFCGDSFSSFNQAKIHYAKEHSNSSDHSKSQNGKRPKRAR